MELPDGSFVWSGRVKAVIVEYRYLDVSMFAKPLVKWCVLVEYGASESDSIEIDATDEADARRIAKEIAAKVELGP